MADELVTQVSRTGAPATAPPARRKKRGFLQSILCCFSSSSSLSGKYRPGEYLLPPQTGKDIGKKCLVLDLDETLVHSSFKPVMSADFIVPVEIENQVHKVYVLKRPGVDAFLKRMGEIYEVVVFTASLSKYADPVMDLLDQHRVCTHRLFRESCVNHKGNYVKDMGQLGRDLKTVIIIDNSPASYMFNPENAIAIESWFDDMQDTELFDLIPFMEDLAKVDDVTSILNHHAHSMSFYP